MIEKGSLVTVIKYAIRGYANGDSYHQDAESLLYAISDLVENFDDC